MGIIAYISMKNYLKSLRTKAKILAIYKYRKIRRKWLNKWVLKLKWCSIRYQFFLFKERWRMILFEKKILEFEHKILYVKKLNYISLHFQLQIHCVGGSITELPPFLEKFINFPFNLNHSVKIWGNSLVFRNAKKLN